MDFRATRAGLDVPTGFEDKSWFEEIVSGRWVAGDAGMVLNLLRVSSPLAPIAVLVDDVIGRVELEEVCATAERELFVADLSAAFVGLPVFCWLLSPFEP